MYVSTPSSPGPSACAPVPPPRTSLSTDRRPEPGALLLRFIAAKVTVLLATALFGHRSENAPDEDVRESLARVVANGDGRRRVGVEEAPAGADDPEWSQESVVRGYRRVEVIARSA